MRPFAKRAKKQIFVFFFLMFVVLDHLFNIFFASLSASLFIYVIIIIVIIIVICYLPQNVNVLHGVPWAWVFDGMDVWKLYIQMRGAHI